MHIGSTKRPNICSPIYIDGWKETYVTSVETEITQTEDSYEGQAFLETTLGEKYLGDKISHDGKNDLNIEFKRNKGVGLVNEIRALLVKIMAGCEHFKWAQLRNSCLVSSMVINCEAWYGLTIKQIKLLKKEDEKLMRKILDCPSKTPVHLMYLELGWLPLRFIIQSRRLNFLKYILNQKETSRVKQVFNEQKLNPLKGVCLKIVEKYLGKLKIDLTHEERTCMSKTKL